jgi:60 kDa SS-A/Ro ribonucleoprotein
MKTYLGQGTRITPQSKPIPNSKQVQNSAGGYAFAVDDWKRLERFLILGSEGGSYYAKQSELTAKNAEASQRCVESDGQRVVKLVAEISDQGRAAKNDPALFVLAMCVGSKQLLVRQAALDVLPLVARTGTHLFHFLAYVEQFRGWGRGLRRGVGDWYNQMPADKLAYQVIKYQQRDGWSHHDLLHLSHPKPIDPAHNAIYAWAKNGELTSDSPAWLHGFVEVQKAENAAHAANIIKAYKLPREAVPTQFLNESKVWEALLEDMPMTAMIRNLATMTKIGLIAPMSDATRKVVVELSDTERLKKSRVHPIAVLFALKVYEQGHGEKSDAKWEPVTKVVDALDSAFYGAFGNVEPTGKRMSLALDVSGSMGGSFIAGTSLSAREASAAMALITAKTETDYEINGFATSFIPMTISPKQRLDDVVRKISNIPFGGTDCALPMVNALARQNKIDAFVVYTDSETWAGGIHPTQALQQYREKMGIQARLAVVGMVANEFSVADPNDAGQMDVVGFDTSTPQVISDFAAGKL